ncbi:MAG: hypothetical protein M3198_03740 [Actinomycetota bacterium]|nr:hypothetical protein [Actinomycetota bacterium]
MPDPLLWTFQALLAVVFAWAAVAKTLQWRAWRSSLASYGIPRTIETPVAVLVPVAEVTVVLLVLGGVARVAMASALALLAAFCLAVLRARSREGDRLPCGCFGKTEARDYRLMLVRNAALSALAGLVLLGGDGLDPVTAGDVPEPGEVLPATLVIIGILLGGWILKQATSSMKRREHM